LFWAHSDPDGLSPWAEGARWQPLSSHLREVASLAERLAQNASLTDVKFHRMAREAGLLHDVGKYAPSFQRLIRGEIQKDPGGHAARGAALAWFPGKSRARIETSEGTTPSRIETTSSPHHRFALDIFRTSDFICRALLRRATSRSSRA